jgi:hypothetical protein
MARFISTPHSRKSAALWLVFNALILAAWLITAWIIWPWPNYGYCDIPVMSRLFLFDLAPGLIALTQVVLLFIVVIRAISSRDFAISAALLVTAAAWYALAGYNFNPKASPGEGCLTRGAGHLTNAWSGRES